LRRCVQRHDSPATVHVKAAADARVGEPKDEAARHDELEHASPPLAQVLDAVRRLLTPARGRKEVALDPLVEIREALLHAALLKGADGSRVNLPVEQPMQQAL